MVNGYRRERRAFEVVPNARYSVTNSMPEPNSLVVLVFDGHDADLVRTVADDHLTAQPVVVERCGLPVADAVRSSRERYGGCPLGAMASDETGVMDALDAGADEARVVEMTPASILAFLDAVRLRARLRRDQERGQANAVQAEKLAALGIVVAGVAHEVNNPLAALLLSVEALKPQVEPLVRGGGYLRELLERGTGASVNELARLEEQMRTGAPAEEATELLREIGEAADTIAHVVRDLKIFAREKGDEEPQVVFLPDLVDQVVRVVGREIVPYGHLERDYEPDVPPVVIPRGRLAQVLTNVLINAAHAIREVARPIHRVRITIRADDEAVAISVSDTGPGVAAEAIPHIFDPFFTTKRETLGTGLGLSISRSILRRFDGDLLVESVHGDGATFIALIPRPSREQLMSAYGGARVGTGRSATVPRRSVLVVDDDERMLRAYSRALAADCDVLLAFDGEEAIDLLRSGSVAEVVLSDLGMPTVDGPKLHAWLREHRPELARRMLFVSADASRYQSFLDEVSNPVLAKPVSRSELLLAIDQIMDDQNPLPTD